MAWMENTTVEDARPVQRTLSGDPDLSVSNSGPEAVSSVHSPHSGHRKSHRRDSTVKERRERWVRNLSRAAGVLVLIVIFALLWHFSREGSSSP